MHIQSPKHSFSQYTDDEILASFGIRRNSRYSNDQKMFLENFYENVSKYPSSKQRIEIGGKLSMNEAQVGNWFRHRRERKS